MKRSGMCFYQILFGALLMLLVLAAAACVPQHYAENDRKNVEEASRKLLTEWLETLPETCELTDVSMVYGHEPGENPYTGYYLSQISYARFTDGGNQYMAYVNNEDGSILTNYYGIDAGKYLKELLRTYCEAHGYTADFEVTRVSPMYTVLSHGTDAWNHSDKETVVEFAELDVYPADITEENAEERMAELLRGADLGRVEITFISDSGLSFDPEILMDLIREREGNPEGSGQTGQALSGIEMSMDVKIQAGDPEEGDEDGLAYSPYPKAGSAELILYGDGSDPLYRFLEFGHQKVDTVSVEYIKKSWEGSPAEFNYEALTEEPCTILFDEDTLRYTGDSNHYAYLFFEEKPAYTKAWRSFVEGTPSDTQPDELTFTEINGVVWSLNSEENRYLGGFYLEPRMPQMLIFE